MLAMFVNDGIVFLCFVVSFIVLCVLASLIIKELYRRS
jgi:hypothetical protein